MDALATGSSALFALSDDSIERNADPTFYESKSRLEAHGALHSELTPPSLGRHSHATAEYIAGFGVLYLQNRKDL